MRADNEAIIDRAAFIKAVFDRRPRRGPVRIRGAHSTVPRDVLIYAEGRALILDGPTVAVSLPMEGRWSVCISVPAAELAVAAPALRPGERLSIVFAAGSLILDSGAIVIPARETARD